MSLVTSKQSRIIGHVLFVIVILLAFNTGRLTFNNWQFIENSKTIDAIVYNKYESRIQSSTNTTQYSRALKLTYQFENPYVKDKSELLSELAPIAYYAFEPKQKIKIYFNPLEKNKAKISYWPQFWLLTLINLIALCFLLFIYLRIAKNAKKVTAIPVALLLPLLFGYVQTDFSASQANKERLAELTWPKWATFETAVPKPSWWPQVNIKYLDPMNYSDQEYQDYVKKNDGPDKFKRKFKIAYALMLKNQNDAKKLAGILSQGTTREFMPLYEFYLNNFQTAHWQSEYCETCNDASAMLEMAGELVSMKLDENQVISSQVILQSLLEKKYDRASLRARYYFLYSYRRLLEHTHGQDAAKAKLDALVRTNIKLAEQQGKRVQMNKWLSFWHSDQRTVGMFTKKRL